MKRSRSKSSSNENTSGIVVVEPSPLLPAVMQEAIASIPVNPDSKLDRETRRIFLAKLIKLREGVKKMREEQKSETERRMLEAYRDESGWPKLQEQLQKAMGTVQHILDQMADIGLDEHGNLAATNTSYHGEPRRLVGANVDVKIESTRKADIKRPLNKIEVAMNLSAIFSEFDALEVRMAMAATFREAATIMNAAAGTNIIQFTLPGVEVVPEPGRKQA